MKSLFFFLLLLLATAENAFAQVPLTNKQKVPKLTIDPCTKTGASFSEYIRHLNSNPVGQSPLLGIHLSCYFLPEGEPLNPTSVNPQTNQRLYYNITTADGMNLPEGGFLLGPQGFNGSCMIEQSVRPLTNPTNGNNDFFGPFQLHLGILAGIKIGGFDYTYDHNLGAGQFVFKCTTTSEGKRLWLLLKLYKTSIN